MSFLGFLITITSAVICAFNVTPNEDVVYEENTIYHEEEIINDADEYIENCVYCSVDANALSIGEIIPEEIVVTNGETCAEIFVQLLEGAGYLPIYSGTTTEGFYLSGIGGIDTQAIEINENIKAYLTENDIDFNENVTIDGELSEFDITDCAGWVFTVNDELPSVGMCDYIPSDGDVIRLVFTLNYGEDIYLVD